MRNISIIQSCECRGLPFCSDMCFWCDCLCWHFAHWCLLIIGWKATREEVREYCY